MSPKEGRPSTATLDLYHKEASGGQDSDRRLIVSVWAFLLPHHAWLVAALTSIVLTAGLSLLRPIIMLKTLDGAIASKDPKVMLIGGAIFAAVAILEQALGFVQIYSTQIVGARAMADLRSHIFRFLGHLPLRFFDNQPVGRLVTRVTNDVDAMLELFSSGALSALGDLLRLVGVVVIMLFLDWQLSLVGFAALPFVVLLMMWVRGRAREAFRSIRGETARMNSNMNEQVDGVALVQAYSREEALFDEFDGINRSYRDANIRAVKYDAIQDAAIDAISSVSLASVVMALGYQDASYGTVVALTFYLKQFFEPISMLAQRYTLLQAALSGAERVFGLLAVSHRDAPKSEEYQADEVDAPYAIELEDVTFAYKPGLDVLHRVSLRVRPGETVALVGPTGSGKSTMTALLLRLYEHHEGTVKVFGKDTRGMSREELRRQFAIVPQDVFLFPGTLAENIAAGEAPDRSRVEWVLREMGIDDLLLGRKEGLDAEVKVGGTNFSAGERQLIAFARALYRDAPILVLDEATASVDSDTELRMQRALFKLMEGRTTIVVAHRLSTISAADSIAVLQKGRVVEQGNHEELVAQGGLYAALHRLQFSRADEERFPA